MDDELLERKALTKMINSSLDCVTVVGEASNGRKAIEMVDRLQPDIVLMDIKMPGINGIEAVKVIRKRSPSIRFIMVSAFNTFEHAKEVMQQGVKEYVLKPSRQQDILDSIQRVSMEIFEERKQLAEQKNLRENLERAVTIAQKEWFSSLLLNQVQNISFDEWGRLLGVEIISGYIMIFTIQPKETKLVDATIIQQVYSTIEKILNNIVLNRTFMIGPAISTHLPVLFLCKQESENKHITGTIQKIINQFTIQYKLANIPADVKIGIGSNYKQARELIKSYYEALSASKQIINSSNLHYMYSRKNKNDTVLVENDVFELEKKLVEAVQQGDLNDVLLMLDSFIDKLEKKENEGETVVRAFEALFILISKMLHELGISHETYPLLKDFNDKYIMYERVRAYVISVVQDVQIWRNRYGKGMMHQAKKFIESNYANHMTLEIVADHVGISPYYFSKLFKDRYGLTFIDYLTEIRIQKAKEEMLHSTKNLKEICYAIGYKDPNYFSRVFKKHTGLSPSEYRRITSN